MFGEPRHWKKFGEPERRGRTKELPVGGQGHRLVVHLQRLFPRRLLRLRHCQTAHRDSPSDWLGGPDHRCCCFRRRWDRTMRPYSLRRFACSSWLGKEEE